MFSRCHGNCLLEWLSAQESTPNRPDGAIKCPQCATEYTIVSYQPPLLRLFDTIHARIVLLGAATAVGGVVFVTAGFVFLAAAGYGATAFEAFVGEKNFQLIYGDASSGLTFWAMTDWVFVPWSLYTAGTQRTLFYNFTSVLCACPLTITASHTPDTPWGFLASPVASLTIFPLLIPLRNLVYNQLKAWVTRKAALPIEDLSSHRPTVRTLNNVPGMPGVVVNFVDVRGNAVARVQAVGQLAPVVVPAVGGGIAGNINDVEAGPVGNNLNRILRSAGLGTALVKPLFVPWIAKGMGTVLLGMSDYWKPLKSVLFVQQREFPLIRYHGTTIGANAGFPWTWNDLDPVWWRNSLGYALFTILSDGFQLWYTYLIERERQSRRVVSRSFEGIDASGLDLIPDSHHVA